MKILKDLFRAISSVETEFGDILSNSNYEFSNFRNEIVKLHKRANRNGLYNLAAIQLIIDDLKNKNTEEYSVSLSLFYKINNKETVKQLERKYILFGIYGLPKLIKESLEKEGNFRIVFDQSDIEEFIDNKDLSINNSNISLAILVKDILRSEKIKDYKNIVISIKEFWLYKRVQLFIREEPNIKYLTEFLVSKLTDIDKRSLNEFEKEGKTEFTFIFDEK